MDVDAIQKRQSQRWAIVSCVYRKTKGNCGSHLGLSATDVGIPYDEFMTAINYLEQRGYMVVDRADGMVFVQLTSDGIELVESGESSLLSSRQNVSSQTSPPEQVINISNATIGSLQQGGTGNSATVSQSSASPVHGVHDNSGVGALMVQYKFVALNEIATLAEPLLRLVAQHLAMGNRYAQAYDSIQEYTARVRAAAHLLDEHLVDDLCQYSAELFDALMKRGAGTNPDALPQLKSHYDRLVRCIRNAISG